MRRYEWNCLNVVTKCLFLYWYKDLGAKLHRPSRGWINGATTNQVTGLIMVDLSVTRTTIQKKDFNSQRSTTRTLNIPAKIDALINVSQLYNTNITCLTLKLMSIIYHHLSGSEVPYSNYWWRDMNSKIGRDGASVNSFHHASTNRNGHVFVRPDKRT